MIANVLLILILSRSVRSYPQEEEPNADLEVSNGRNSKRSSAHFTPLYCDRKEIAYQMSKIVRDGELHICDGGLAWKLAQMAIPNARTFFDVGANRAYISAQIFGLWSPGNGLHRRSLFDMISKDFHDKKTNNPLNLDTFCKDGTFFDQPMYCLGRPWNTHIEQNSRSASASPPVCPVRNSINVYSFDGDLSHVTNQRRTIYYHWPHLHPDFKFRGSDGKEGDAQNNLLQQTKSSWVYFHSAFTGPKIPEGITHGYFEQRASEGGKLVPLTQMSGGGGVGGGSSRAGTGAMLVPLFTVDTFCEKNNITVLDVLKIDAEGHDVDILMGSSETLKHRGVKLLTFEANHEHMHKWIPAIELLGTKEYQFDCYMGAKSDYLARASHCIDFAYFKNLSRIFLEKKGDDEGIRINTNVYCAHRKRVPHLVKMMNDVSLYNFASLDRGVILDAMKANPGSTRPDGYKLSVNVPLLESMTNAAAVVVPSSKRIYSTADQDLNIYKMKRLGRGYRSTARKQPTRQNNP